MAASLTSEESFAGWGIRTVAADARRYNPMSYHNGSIWPHDNSLIAAGFVRYGLETETRKILTGLLDASLFFDLHRLPELFCGFARRAGEAPTLYPVACSPQAWAAGAVLLIFQSVLGFTISGRERRVVFARNTLPDFLDEVIIRQLQVGDASVDLVIARRNGQVSVSVPRKSGDLEVVVYR